MSLHSSLYRKEIINKLKNEPYDLIVIGGGITGAGIALDAAARGMKVALLEKNDFASGTSSKSTKLIHGGLRYLKQFEIGLVREVGRERVEPVLSQRPVDALSSVQDLRVVRAPVEVRRESFEHLVATVAEDRVR